MGKSQHLHFRVPLNWQSLWGIQFQVKDISTFPRSSRWIGITIYRLADLVFLCYHPMNYYTFLLCTEECEDFSAWVRSSHSHRAKYAIETTWDHHVLYYFLNVFMNSKILTAWDSYIIIMSTWISKAVWIQVDEYFWISDGDAHTHPQIQYKETTFPPFCGSAAQNLEGVVLPKSSFLPLREYLSSITTKYKFLYHKLTTFVYLSFLWLLSLSGFLQIKTHAVIIKFERDTIWGAFVCKSWFMYDEIWSLILILNWTVWKVDANYVKRCLDLDLSK